MVKKYANYCYICLSCFQICHFHSKSSVREFGHKKFVVSKYNSVNQFTIIIIGNCPWITPHHIPTHPPLPLHPSPTFLPPNSLRAHTHYTRTLPFPFQASWTGFRVPGHWDANFTMEFIRFPFARVKFGKLGWLVAKSLLDGATITLPVVTVRLLVEMKWAKMA